MTPIRPSDFRSRSRLNARDHKRDEACPEGTPRCLCRKLAELYESGRLKLYRGTVSRARLEDHLGLGRNTLSPKARAAPQEAPGRCLRRFDQLLESWGHGTVWTEKIPAIRRVLEARKAAGTLPVNERGNLNRTEILREFGVGDGSVHVIQRRAPKLQAVLDAYDTTRDDPAYTAYKHDVLETRLKKVLASREPKLTHGRIVSPKWLADRLGVTPATLTSTPKLNDLIEEKQREIDRQLRQGRTRKSFRVGGASHINLGARPYSKTHKRAFDFSGLVPDYGLEYAEKVGTVFIALSEGLVNPKSHYHRIRHFLGWLVTGPSGDIAIAERFRRRQKVERTEFERAVLLYKSELTYEEGAGGRAHKRLVHLTSIIEKFGEAGLFPPVWIPRASRDKARANKHSTTEPR